MRAALLGFIATLALAFGAQAQEDERLTDAERAQAAGVWTGTWTSDTHLFDGEMTLEVSDEGEVEGQIVWTLRISPYPEDEARIGLTGTEHVRGRYDPDMGALRLDGHQKDDPNNIIGLDGYRLILGGNRRTMAGLTGNHGTWDGLVQMRR